MPAVHNLEFSFWISVACADPGILFDFRELPQLRKVGSGAGSGAGSWGLAPCSLWATAPLTLGEIQRSLSYSGPFFPPHVLGSTHPHKALLALPASGCGECCE